MEKPKARLDYQAGFFSVSALGFQHFPPVNFAPQAGRLCHIPRKLETCTGNGNTNWHQSWGSSVNIIVNLYPERIDGCSRAQCPPASVMMFSYQRPRRVAKQIWLWPPVGPKNMPTWSLGVVSLNPRLMAVIPPGYSRFFTSQAATKLYPESVVTYFWLCLSFWLQTEIQNQPVVWKGRAMQAFS